MSDDAIRATRLGREYLRGRERLQKEGALFVACSEFVRKQAIDRGYPADRTIVHSIGVDVAEFEPPPYRRREEAVLFVGRLVEKKGCGDLIEAMVQVQQHCPEAELIVIGDGPLRAGCEALAAALRVRSRFLRSQPPTVVKEWMSRAAVFCVPSVIAATGDAEGFGIVFIEAQAMGLPVVSTRSGGIPEAVDEGETGLLVSQNAPDRLSEAIVRLLQDGNLWRRFSVAGRRRVVLRFNLARQTQRLEDIFGGIVAMQRKTGRNNVTGRDNVGVPAGRVTAYSTQGLRDLSAPDSSRQSATAVDQRSVDGGPIN
jgi:glycosyltransferase involved in cell wall biosynthesis